MAPSTLAWTRASTGAEALGHPLALVLHTMSQLPLVAFLEQYQLTALAKPLLALGVEQVDDLRHLDEDDLEELRGNLKKVQLKKFDVAIESVKAPPDSIWRERLSKKEAKRCAACTIAPRMAL